MSWTDEKIEELLYRENLVIPPLSYRLGSFLVDFIFIVFVSWGFCASFLASDLSGVEAKIFFIQKIFFFTFCFSLLYEICFIYFYGVSLGKILFKLKIISLKTLDTPIFSEVLQRSWLKVFEEFIGWVLFIFTLDNKFFRAPHDKISETIVVIAW